MEAQRVTLVYHPACSECELVRETLDKHKVPYDTRDLFRTPLGREELFALLDGQDLRRFLNPRSTEYRDRGMKGRTPTLEMAVELMVREPRLLRCPILLRGDEVFPVIIETDATAPPPELLKFLGIEVAKPRAKAAGAAHKPAAPAPKPAAPAALAPASEKPSP